MGFFIHDAISYAFLFLLFFLNFPVNNKANNTGKKWIVKKKETAKTVIVHTNHVRVKVYVATVYLTI
jgi:hypothetical protein